MKITQLHAKLILGLGVFFVLANVTDPYLGHAGVLQETRVLDQVLVTDLGDRVRVEVTGQDSLRYKVSAVSVPARATLQLPGYSKGPTLRRMDVHIPPLLEIIPKEYRDPLSGLDLVFRLTTPVEPEVRVDEKGLILDFLKDPTEPATVQMDSAPWAKGLEQSQTEQGSSPVLSAHMPSASGMPGQVMIKIEVQRGEAEAVVKIYGDGPVTYKDELIDQGRLVVDLPGMASALHRQVLPVDHRLLKRIRVGHHADKVRLVFDLPTSVTYFIQQQDQHLAVHLSAGDPSMSLSKTRTLTTPPLSTTMAKQSHRDAKNESPTNVEEFPPRPTLKKVSLSQVKPRLAQMGTSVSRSPGGGEGSSKRFKGRRISLDFQAADISNVFRLIAEVSGLNIVVGEGVKAKVTMKLVNIPWDQALDMLLKMNNLGMVKEGNIVWIDTLANIAKQQDDEAKAQESKIKAEKLVSRVIYVQNVKASEIQATLRQNISPRGRVQVNNATNALVLEDTESKVAEFIRLVRKLDLVAPQVQIEARIVQADTSFTRSLGVQWGYGSNRQQTNTFTTVGNLTGPFAEPVTAGSDGSVTQDFIVNLPAAVTGLSSIPGFGFITGKFDGVNALDMRLSAGELLGLTKVIAAPKVTTLDKQEAKIEQGESIPFQTTSLQGTQTTFVDANLTLQVTPQITSRDPDEKGKNILMKVKVTRNSVGARSNPAGPSIDKREANTQVLVQDGETMVIGGIFVDTQSNNVGGVPYLSRIPVLGWLFKNKTESISKQELLIFLTPTIAT